MRNCRGLQGHFRYSGGLTIELNNILSVSIPNDLLVVPLKTINKDGSISTNDSINVLQIPKRTQPNIFLGAIFFSAAYLSVNYDAGTFTLWNALATETQDLVNLGPQWTNVSSNNSEGGSDTQKQKQGSSLSAGDIAGIVVSCCAVVIAAILLAWWYYRQRRKSRVGQQEVEKSNAASAGQARDSTDFHHGPRFYEAPTNDIQELEVDRYANEAMSNQIQEMQAHRNLRTELQTQERPSELPTQKEVQTGRVRSASPVELG